MRQQQTSTFFAIQNKDIGGPFKPHMHRFWFSFGYRHQIQFKDIAYGIIVFSDKRFLLFE